MEGGWTEGGWTEGRRDGGTEGLHHLRFAKLIEQCGISQQNRARQKVIDCLRCIQMVKDNFHSTVDSHLKIT
jgi:hypothetical protein